MTIETQKCAECGVRFIKKRRDQKFHSAECRKLWWRRAQRGIQAYDMLMKLSRDILDKAPDLAKLIINWRKDDRHGKTERKA